MGSRLKWGSEGGETGGEKKQAVKQMKINQRIYSFYSPACIFFLSLSLLSICIYKVQQPYEKLASVFTGVLPPLCLLL